MLIPLTPFVWSTIQISLLVGVALVVSWLLRGRYPQWTSAMLAGSSLASMILTILIWFPTGHWSLAKFSASTLANATTSGMSKPDAPGVREPLESNAVGTKSLVHPQGQRTELERSLPTSSAIEQFEVWVTSTSDWFRSNVQSVESGLRSFEQSTSQSRTNLGRIQAIACFTTALLAGLWFHGWIWIRSIVRRSHAVEDVDLAHRLRGLATQMGLGRLPSVLESNQVAIGATMGCFRKRLILNAQWKEWSDDELDAVLLHELAHMLRHDFAWVVLSSWIRVLLFYHPLVHLLIRRMRLEQELAADQLAAGAMNNARAYGRALAKLALRAQCVAKVPSPALTAEQVCIIRRITMLKQGSLKPRQRNWRWTPAVIGMTLACTMPLSGLRGTPPEEKTQVAVVTAETSEPSTAQAPPEAVDPEQSKNAREEYALTQKEFPPSSYIGRLKWQPKKLASENTAASLRYIQDLVCFVLFEQFVEQAEIHAPATMTLNWETRAREQGRFSFGATCNEVQGVDSKFILRLLTSPLFTNFSLSSEKKVIGGKQATRLVAKGTNPETRRIATDSDPPLWFVGEEDQFYFGTEEEILARMQSRELPKEEQTLIDVPQEYQSNFEAAGLALVYNDCDQWASRISDYFKGTSKEPELFLILPYLKDLKSIGCFLDSTNSPNPGCLPLSIQITYQTEVAARNGLDAIHSLIDLARASEFDDEYEAFFKEFFGRIEVFHVGNNVVVQCHNSKAADVFCQMVLPEKITGWTDIVSLVQPTESKGTVQFQCNHGFGSAGFLAQSIEAQNYRGKRVRITAEIGCDEGLHARSGLILWGGDTQYRTIGNAASGNSIGAPLDPKKTFDAFVNPPKEDTIQWQTKSVEWNVPMETDVLSFGVYLAAGEVLVRNMKFEVIGASTDNRVEVQLASLPRNLLQIPGRKPLAEPTNLDFSQQSVFTPTESPAAQTATRVDADSKAEVRR